MGAASLVSFPYIQYMKRKPKIWTVYDVPFARAAGAAAIGFAALIVLANAIAVPAGLPSPGTGPEEAAAFFSTEGAAVEASSALTPAAWILAAIFGAGAVAAVRQSERARAEAWSLVGFAGLLLQNAAFAVVIAIRIALSSAAADGAAAGFWSLHDALFTLNGTFLALALVGLSASGLRGGLIRPWHAALGLISAALMLASATIASAVVAGEDPLGLIGLVGWLLWVVWVVAYGIA